jgi:triphosphoribosyl-dephospho-CoA synthetase
VHDARRKLQADVIMNLYIEKAKQLSPSTSAVDNLSDYDDICTDLLVDKVLFWSKIHKMAKNYKAKRTVSEREILDAIRDMVLEKTTLSEAADTVMGYTQWFLRANL